MAENKDTGALLQEEMARHEETKAELERCRSSCASWESAYHGAMATVTQLSAKASYFEMMFSAAETRNLPLKMENRRLNLTLRHLAPWSLISTPSPASCPALESDAEDYDVQEITDSEGDRSDTSSS
ncbi:hypothetical protein VFPPC_14939 [Pochonia chlamydosporia 170]|uniref:Uncharacterized protein n=1 Tax=Pochonia chlamydosporia 170 TaxID=1380566 RepID=A0A179FVL5_METCM|nr:hypothetical protein VFPPC_14939 [Pochonia chlamydosporia 170]OAQ69278.1 hypothetical protein VFPPC_14939 [Pochonia chlamydosporia 170]